MINTTPLNSIHADDIPSDLQEALLDLENHLKKQQGIVYVTGHVRKGIASRFTGKISIIEKIENWQGTGEVFEYYRRELDLHL